MHRSIKILSLFIAMITLNACALSVDTVPVPYQEPTAKISIGADGKAFQVNVLDLRTKYKGRIGAKVNGFGAEMADIKSTVPVRDIVANAIQSELQARNIVVGASDPKSVDAEITAFHNNFKIGLVSGSARAIVTMGVKVKNASGTILYDNTVSEVNELPGILLASGENAAQSLEAALKLSMDKLFSDTEFLKALADA